MADSDRVLAEAKSRAAQMGLPYSGAVTPAEAFELLRSNPAARLVDVRSRAEWDFVGRVPGAIEIEWKSYPGMRPNEAFFDQLRASVPTDAPVLFLCRSGGRSHEAAMLATRAGWRECYNVLEGFEGDRDGAGHRNTVGGWRAAGLPWSQG